MDALWLLCVAVTCLTQVAGQGIVIQNIRLVNGPSVNSGRLEVQVNGNWGTVCDDQWDELDASVACKQLGYPNGGSARERAAFGQGTGTIFVDDTACDGSEQRLDECQMTTTSDCTHAEDAGVVCVPNTGNPVTATTTTTPTPTVAPVPDNCAAGANLNVRLVAVNNTLRGMGYVEVRNGAGGTWGSVCDDFFDENAARVVCRNLCFDPLNARAGAPAWAVGQPRLPIILDDVRCNGNEPNIQACTHRQWDQHNCGPLEVANVNCVLLDSNPPQPPQPYLDCYQGFLIAIFNKSRDQNLEQKHLTISKPFSGTCNLDFLESNQTITMRIPFESCGTEVSLNRTHLIYSNVIKYDQTSATGSISRVNTYLVEVYCEMPRNPSVTRPFDPQTQVVTQKSTGQFVVTMTFYRNNSFSDPVTQFPLRLPIGEWLNVALQLESIDSRLKLVVPDCVATPDSDINSAINYPLFTNSCAEEPTLNFVNFNQTRFGYRYQPFMFVNYPSVFLHCGAFVCLMNETNAQCDRSCNNAKPQPTTNRRKRDAPKEKIYVHSGPLVVYKLDNSMTVLERVGEPQTYSTTFSLPLETSTPTPTPTTTAAVGTSVKVVHTGTTSVVTSSSGNENVGTSTLKPVTPTFHDVTTRSNDVTSIKPETSTQSNLPLDKVTTDREEDNTKTTTQGKKTTSVKADEITNAPPPSPGGGFVIERGESTANEFSSAENRISNVIKGFVPDFISGSVTVVPCILTLCSLFTAVVILS